jgi:hypothetical protein
MIDASATIPKTLPASSFQLPASSFQLPASSFQQKTLDPNTTPAPTLIRLQLAACSLQLAACSLQLAACSLQLAAYLLLKTTAPSKQSGWLGLML